MNKIKFKIFLLINLLVTWPSLVKAGVLQDALTTAQATNQKAKLAATDDPAFLVGNIIKYALGFVGTIFLVLIIYGGFLWMTAAGNDQQIEKARKILTSSTVGLLIVVLAYALSLFIINVILSATGSV